MPYLFTYKNHKEFSISNTTNALKKLLFEKLYQHKNIVRRMYVGKQAVEGIYKGLMDEEKMLPKFHYDQLQKRNKHRVVADYIASMSDRYALSFYNEMYGKI